MIGIVTIYLIAAVLSAQNIQGTCYCPFIFSPVCGVNGQTYSNSCQANCARVNIAYSGACLTLGSGNQGGNQNTCNCPLTNSPVCGNNNVTYTNSCFATCAGVNIAYNGSCRLGTGSPGNCNCTAIYQPVCGTNNQNYSSPCQANCAGVNVAYYGQCRNLGAGNNNNNNNNNCNCSNVYIPVCGTNNQNYTSPCAANCAGVNVAYNGLCRNLGGSNPNTCVCSTNSQPVCGVNGVTYINECRLNCANVQKAFNGSCPAYARIATPNNNIGASPFNAGQSQ